MRMDAIVVDHGRAADEQAAAVVAGQIEAVSPLRRGMKKACQLHTKSVGAAGKAFDIKALERPCAVRFPERGEIGERAEGLVPRLRLEGHRLLGHAPPPAFRKEEGRDEMATIAVVEREGGHPARRTRVEGILEECVERGRRPFCSEVAKGPLVGEMGRGREPIAMTGPAANAVVDRHPVARPGILGPRKRPSGKLPGGSEIMGDRLGCQRSRPFVEIRKHLGHRRAGVSRGGVAEVGRDPGRIDPLADPVEDRPCLGADVGFRRAGPMAIHAAEFTEEQEPRFDPIDRIVSLAAKTFEAGDDRRRDRGRHSQAGRHPDDECGTQGTTRSQRHGQSPLDDDRHGPLGSPGDHEYSGIPAARSGRVES